VAIRRKILNNNNFNFTNRHFFPLPLKNTLSFRMNPPALLCRSGYAKAMLADE
jgi:hypothetical protein